MAAPGATPLPWARLPPGCSTVRSFAASAADSLCNRSASDGLQEPLAEAVAAEDAARMVLEDPMSRLMASRGMPLGLSLRRQEAAGGGGTAAAGGSDSSSSSGSSGIVGGDGGAAAPSADDDDDNDDDDGGPDHVSEGVLSPSEQKYASLEAMSADIKKLDEVFEVLASVPWLDEDVLAEKELKGVAQVGLLGTLEEVGFNVRHQLLRIWSGERGAELAAGPGLEFRDQAALLAILYHTQQIEERHGPPPRGYLPKPPTSPPQQH
ncbi:hypothetical protein VOLCADRAFT_104782 [Volvox carteri f. nagariensis]|uniref:Uncharacterized protein n=1 Tax=Volvox carteri f. nagariensis TaxID=3068 RepID=D8TW09_VOLCA|nr:uncharacterized protein VOLCADRAFT_104782 [Volvox carteri f. nagariensis]EFJ48396.1 hypothetical protein VOLCADRAFT_104782 [Volvox carteri f. nagariensis]|eukprot:XP_002950650.1 hypothetical protein VOLCADRAFT_104782 [Volvox carteri f. nagariensis]